STPSTKRERGSRGRARRSNDRPRRSQAHRASRFDAEGPRRGGSSLSFENPSARLWGVMLNEGRQYLEFATHLAIFPGLAIMIAVLGFNLLGDGLRDALDPQRR